MVFILEVCVVGELFNREVLLCKQVRASVVPLSHQWTSGHIKCTCCNLPTAPPPPPAENTINAAAAISLSSWYFLNRHGWAAWFMYCTPDVTATEIYSSVYLPYLQLLPTKDKLLFWPLLVEVRDRWQSHIYMFVYAMGSSYFWKHKDTKKKINIVKGKILQAITSFSISELTMIRNTSSSAL